MLRKAARALQHSGEFTTEQAHNYHMSVTEREVGCAAKLAVIHDSQVIRGCIAADNVKDHVIVYSRILSNINLQNNKRAAAFIDLVEGRVDQEAVDLLSHYRDELAMKKMEQEGGIYRRAEISWIGREGLSEDTHKTYLSDFVTHFYKNVVKLIDRAMKKEMATSANTKLALEILHHLHACKKSCEVFLGREQELGVLRAYIEGEVRTPLVLHGQGGSGKTALLGQTAWLVQTSWLASNCSPLLVVRYCGSTPDSNSVILLLRSICLQLSYNFNLPSADVPMEQAPLLIYLKQLLGRATSRHPVHVFLDSMDEISEEPLRWIPANLPPHCKLIVSMTRDSGDSWRWENFPRVEVPPLGPALARDLIHHLLKLEGRTVNNYHNRLLLNALESCSLPIFCMLVFAEVSRWRSYTSPQETYLADNVTDGISLLFQKVEEKHGYLLVAHCLAYVTGARYGLSESEMEDLVSLDDEVLDDLYQYHLPPIRRMPPLLWTRLRSDLPGQLVDSEAGGLLVTTWHHTQFREAAKLRYLSQPKDVAYCHGMMADFFLGTYGGGNPKAFRYTEVQRHRFGLKSKEAEADRQVPDMPLVFKSEADKVRYNLRKLGELPHHLARAGRIQDLCRHCLFNYQWLHAKLTSGPLSSLLADFEDALAFLEDEETMRAVQLVADCVRLGGSTLSSQPAMLGAQVTGRLLPVAATSAHIHSLIRQCDKAAGNINSLVPAFHCLHTPGGPLRFSLEGHQFAVFGFRLTSDLRHIISVSNKVITFDLGTGDTSRTVYPSMVGLMMEVALCPNDKYVVAYTNNQQTILLDSTTGQFQLMPNPFPSENIQVTQGERPHHCHAGRLHAGGPVCHLQPHHVEGVQPGV